MNDDDRKSLMDLIETASPATVSMLALYNDLDPDRIKAAITAVENLRERNDLTERGLLIDVIEDRVVLLRRGVVADEEPVTYTKKLKVNFRFRKRRRR